MSIPLSAILLTAFAYLSGSLPFGYWAGLMKGMDIRKHGSGNIGATNVIRVLGKGIGIPVFILDMLKGLVPVVLAEGWMKHQAASPSTASIVAVCCAAATVLGHMFTFWIGFKGGKGVATSAGALIGLAPFSLLIALITWLVVYFSTRLVAMASIASAVALPIAMALVMTYQGTWNFVLLGLGIVLGVLVVVRHRSNMVRMLSGTEHRFEKKKS